MRYTANYSLKEPQKNVDLADVEDLNDNFEDIDEIMHNTQISLAPPYDQTLTYAVGDLVMYENLLYKCITDITVAEAWDSTKWERAVLSDSAGGGGGNANVTELTYNQYLALSQAEKTNGTIYMVTDDPSDSSGGGGGGSGINYSYTEQDTGLTWVDGKNIYQRTFTTGTLPNNSTIVIAQDLTYIDHIIDYKGFVESGVREGYERQIPFVGGETNDIRVDFNNYDLRLQTFSEWDSYSGYLTIWYTKLTPSQA